MVCLRITEDQIKTRDQTGNLAGQKGIESKVIHSLRGCGQMATSKPQKCGNAFLRPFDGDKGSIFSPYLLTPLPSGFLHINTEISETTGDDQAKSKS